MLQAALRNSVRLLKSGRPHLPPAQGRAAALSSESNTRTVTPGSVVGGDDTEDAAAASPTYETQSPEANRRRALSLYRRLLRSAERMPTPNRQNYVKRKTQEEYRKHKALTDPQEIEFQLRLADTNLDTVMVQAEHLSRLFSNPEYQNYN